MKKRKNIVKSLTKRAKNKPIGYILPDGSGFFKMTVGTKKKDKV